MGCTTSRSADDGVIDSNRDPRQIAIMALNDPHRSGRSFNTNTDTVNAIMEPQPVILNTRRNGSDPLYFAPNQAQYRFEFGEDFQGRHIHPTPGSNTAHASQSRNTRLTILNMPRTRPRRTTTRVDAENPDSSDAAVLEQLQLDLVTIERIFQSLLGHPYQATNATDIRVVTGDDSCPPASAHAIENLPAIQIAKEDLEDENNRSCCICFGDHALGDHVARLPCGHLFHRECVGEWLHKHCTCPFCRWELPTDVLHFEEGRLERMRSRRIRLKQHELERMSLMELKDLALTRLNDDDDNDDDDDDKDGHNDKDVESLKSSLEKASRAELLEKIKRSKQIDIILPSPKVSKRNLEEVILPSSEESKGTVEEVAKTTSHNLDELRSMDIEGLQQILHESGISCNDDTDDDTTGTKERMVQLLVKNKAVVKSLDSNPTDSDMKAHAIDKEEEKEEIGVADAMVEVD